MKYERPQSNRVGALRFLGYQWLKLFKLMVLGFIACVLVYDVWCGFEFLPWNETVSQLAMVSNFLFQSPGAAIVPGPYWFLGLMMEVYVIYRLLFYSTRNYTHCSWLMPVMLIIIAWFMMVINGSNVKILNYLRYNAVVAMLPFALGVIVARYGLPKFKKWLLALIAVLSLPLIAVANLNFHAWLWAPILVVAGAVAFVKLFEGHSVKASGLVMRPLAWMGIMSPFIFVVHSVPRMPMFKFFLWRQPQLMLSDYAWLAAYIFLTLMLAWLYKQILRYIPSPRL